MTFPIPFNRPSVVGQELTYVEQAAASRHLSGDGPFAKRCETLLEEAFGFHRVLLTTSCSGALDLGAVLCGLEHGTEAILPSFTFTSTANAVMKAGARPVFVDIREDTLNLDESQVEAAVTDRTRLILPVHYAGVGCEMDALLEVAGRHGLRVMEDAAQGIDASYRGRPLGGIGDIGTFSFHETKNVIAGEGGALIVNDPGLVDRAEILREKGTNRAQFFRGAVDKYTWVDVGSSEVASELVAAFLLGQLERHEAIRERRLWLWRRYHEAFEAAETQGWLRRPRIPGHCDANGHIYHVLLPTEEARNALMDTLRADGILAVFHYLPLHLSPVGRGLGYGPGDLPVTESLSGRLLRMPLFHSLDEADQDRVIEATLAHLRS